MIGMKSWKNIFLILISVTKNEKRCARIGRIFFVAISHSAFGRCGRGIYKEFKNTSDYLQRPGVRWGETSLKRRHEPWLR